MATSIQEGNKLSRAERSRLHVLEATVDRGVKSFVEAGKALREIRDSRLYREHYKRFEDYCDDRWGFGRNRANRLIEAFGVVANIAEPSSAATENGAHGHQKSPPANERQARELAKLPPEEQASAWEEVTQTTVRPTARDVRAIVEKRKSAAASPKWPRGSDGNIEQAINAAADEEEQEDADEWGGSWDAKAEPAADDPKRPREKVHRADANLPEEYFDEDGTPVPEAMWPVWRDIDQFFTLAEQVRGGGIIEAADRLHELGSKHDHSGILEISGRLKELHREAVELVLSAKPATVRGDKWFIRAEG